MELTQRERSEVEAANASGREPVVFIHGLWLLASSWDRWRALFEAHGYAPLAPGWPGEPDTVEHARAFPEVFAGTSVGAVVDHVVQVIEGLGRRPAVVGHSFGGTVAQILAGRGLARSTVAIDPAPFRGVLPLPWSTLRASVPVLRDPRNRSRAVTLTLEQFRYVFANAVSEAEAAELYEMFAVPASGRPLWQAALANLNPRTEVRVATRNADRGPLLIISGERDNTVPWRIARASYERYDSANAPTELVEIPDRGHSLTIDSGWQEVAETALAFLQPSEAEIEA
jgi:pimeloyl-ACP methyl ester carboxylesterase